jgi:hypothetical protein
VKKTIASFLLFLFLYNTAGYYLAFHFIDYTIKKEIAERILSASSEDLSRVTVEHDKSCDLIWYEEEKEFMMHGKMYDVVRSASDGTVVTYFCINDEKEEQLIGSLLISGMADEDERMPLAKRILKLSQGEFLSFNSLSTDFELNFQSLEYPLKEFQTEHISTVVIPPPRFS